NRRIRRLATRRPPPSQPGAQKLPPVLPHCFIDDVSRDNPCRRWPDEIFQLFFCEATTEPMVRGTSKVLSDSDACEFVRNRVATAQQVGSAPTSQSWLRAIGFL
ncbi:MAG: hypothetical protein V4603_13685, partial [Pseudomonadota bacterium]